MQRVFRDRPFDGAAVVERERQRVGSYIEEARATLGETGPIFPPGFSSEE
ncbi:MAG: hypothetical protein QGH74_02895 [Candidatus Brocadiia bacterium]|jgi:hypothetical protein|nr:hypothetical protein [Candidatus Brocadiia bacterium]